MLSIANFLIIAGIIFNLLILIILLRGQERKFSNNVLALLFILILSTFILFYAILNKIRWLFLSTFILDDIGTLVFGPLIFLYVLSIIRPSRATFKAHFLFYIPAFIHLIAFTIPCFLAIASRKPQFSYIEAIAPYVSFEMLYTLIFCILSYKRLSQHQLLIRENYSNLEHKNLEWIKRLLIGAIMIIFIDLSTTFYEVIWGEPLWNIGYITVLPMVFVVGSLGYYGVSQSQVLIPDFLFRESQSEPQEEIKEESKSLVTTNSDEHIQLEEMLSEIMKTREPFLDENLTLSKLASYLEVTDKKLSALLNQSMNVSFYDYVNGYRIEAVKEKMANPGYDHYTLLAIAFDSGFSSKTSFNRIFKKTEGISPSEYKKQLKA